MPKPKPASLEYSNSKIQAEKLAVLKRTESQMAEILKLCPAEPEIPSQVPTPKLPLLSYYPVSSTAVYCVNALQ